MRHASSARIGARTTRRSAFHHHVSGKTVTMIGMAMATKTSTGKRPSICARRRPIYLATVEITALMDLPDIPEMLGVIGAMVGLFSVHGKRGPGGSNVTAPKCSSVCSGAFYVSCFRAHAVRLSKSRYFEQLKIDNQTVAASLSSG